jgi:hypothetical protein
MPIAFRETRCVMRRTALERDEKKMQRQLDRHICRDPKFCAFAVLENVITEHIGKIAYEHEAEQTASRYQEAIEMLRESQR